MNMQGWCPMISSKTSEGESLSKCTKINCAWWDVEDEYYPAFAATNQLEECGLCNRIVELRDQ